MANDVAVASAWRVKHIKEASLVDPALASMRDSGEIDIRGFLRTVWRRKLLLAVTMVVGLGAIVYWLAKATPRCRVDALIEGRPSRIVRSTKWSRMSAAIQRR